MCKQNKIMNSFTASHWQADVQPSPVKQGSITRNSCLGSQTPSLRRLPLPPSSPTLYAEHDAIWCGTSLWSAVLTVSPPNFLCTLSLLAGGAAWETEEALNLCKHCSAITKILVCYQHWYTDRTPESEWFDSKDKCLIIERDKENW